jgi:multiple sugar transport system substrate-binding protein
VEFGVKLICGVFAACYDMGISEVLNNFMAVQWSKWLSRITAAAIIIPAAYLLIFGPRPNTYRRANGSAIRGRIIVSFWESWTGFEARAMGDVVKRYNRSQSKIYVRVVEMSNPITKSLISIAGGDPPDIIALWSQPMGQFMANDALVPLTPLVRRHVVSQSSFPGWIWRLCAPHGVLYTLPATPETNALYWNKILFKRAGLNPNKPPRTIKQLDRMAERLTIFGRDGRIKQAGFLPNEPDWWTGEWGVWFGNQLYNPRTHHFNLDTPQAIAAYRWYASWPRKLGRNRLKLFESGLGQFASANNPFMDGKVAMEMQGSYFVQFIQRYNKNLIGHYGVAPFPTATGSPRSANWGDCDMWGIPRGARHVNAAMKVLAFFIQQRNIELLNEKQFKASPLLKISPEFFRKNRNPFIREFQKEMTSPGIQTNPANPIVARVKAEVSLAASRVWNGESVTATFRHAQHLVDRWQRDEREIAQRARQMGKN